MNNHLSINNISIRNELLPGDLGYIAYLHGKLYAEELNYGRNFEIYVLHGLQEFAAAYDPAKDKVWICEHEDKIIGCMIGMNRGTALQLRYFIFLPEYRGSGLGKKLMTEFISFGKERKYLSAYLWTTNEQQGAISLYTRFGFTLTEEKESIAFDKPLIELRYDLKL
ncbi:MAG TPA: GNAT family N-acetyltransferase [Chitinophaga sp.]|nr:GNAT family N-acetyltransferase [Chitinophaga sp.]